MPHRNPRVTDTVPEIVLTEIMGDQHKAINWRYQASIIGVLLLITVTCLVAWNCLTLQEKKMLVDATTRTRPENTPGFDVFCLRGIKYLDRKHYQKAVEQFDMAINLKSDFYEAFVGRGRAHQALGHNDLAIKDFNTAVAMQPASAPAFTYRGLYYMAAEDHDHAITDFSRAITLNPEDPRNYNHRARCRIRRDVKEFAEAVNDYKAALKIDPNYSDAATNLKQAMSLQPKMTPDSLH